MYRRFLSQRYLRSRFVNLISVAAVTAGIAVMIVVTAVMDGFQVKVKEVLRGTLSHLVMTPDGTAKPPAFDDLEKTLLRNPDVGGAAPQLRSFVAHPYQATAWDDAKTEFQLLEVVGIDWPREKNIRLAEYLPGGRPEGPLRARHGPRARELFPKTGMFGRSFLQDFIRRDPDTH